MDVIGLQILTLAIAQRLRIVEDTDGSSSQLPDGGDDDSADNLEDLTKARSKGPSEEAVSKFTDFRMCRHGF